MMWKKTENRSKGASSILMLTTATLLLAISSTASATRTEASEMPATPVSQQALVRMDGLASLQAANEGSNLLENTVAVGEAKPDAFKVGLGRTCDDPWWELSGIQFVTCLFV